MSKNIENPNENWSLEELGKFCVATEKRMALGAWKIGLAMYLAKKRCKEAGDSFTAWKVTHGFSNAKVSRYIRLYKAFANKEDRLNNLGIMEALWDAGIAKPKSSSSEEHVAANSKPCAETYEDEVEDTSAATEAKAGLPTKESDTGRPRVAQAANRQSPSSWATEDDSDEEELADTEEYLAEMWSRSETLEEQCRKAVPWQIRHLRQSVETLLDQDIEVLRKAWPDVTAERQELAADMDALIDLIAQLAATLPGESGGAALAVAV